MTNKKLIIENKNLKSSGKNAFLLVINARLTVIRNYRPLTVGPGSAGTHIFTGLFHIKIDTYVFGVYASWPLVFFCKTL